MLVNSVVLLYYTFISTIVSCGTCVVCGLLQKPVLRIISYYCIPRVIIFYGA